MNSGQLRHRLLFQVNRAVHASPQVRDSFGAIVNDWVDDVRIGKNGWLDGLCTYKSGRERELVGGGGDMDMSKRLSLTIADFLIRYQPGLDVDAHRIRFDNRTWNITSIQPDPKHTQLILEASEVI